MKLPHNGNLKLNYQIGIGVALIDWFSFLHCPKMGGGLFEEATGSSAGGQLDRSTVAPSSVLFSQI